MFVEEVFLLISQVQYVGPLAITSCCDMFTQAFLLHVNSDISKQCLKDCALIDSDSKCVICELYKDHSDIEALLWLVSLVGKLFRYVD